MDHISIREQLTAYSDRTGHHVQYHDGGTIKQQPKVPRNKHHNKVWDGSELVAINARHK